MNNLGIFVIVYKDMNLMAQPAKVRRKEKSSSFKYDQFISNLGIKRSNITPINDLFCSFPMQTQMNVWIILVKMVFVSIMREVFNVNVSKDITMIQMEFVLTSTNAKRYI